MSAPPLHPIDALGAALQQARLRTRRLRRRAALAAEAGNVPAARRALARLQAAEAQEARAYRQYAAAVLDTYCGPAPAFIPLPAHVGSGGEQARSVAHGR
jgi:hypothetical protein